MATRFKRVRYRRTKRLERLRLDDEDDPQQERAREIRDFMRRCARMRGSVSIHMRLIAVAMGV